MSIYDRAVVAVCKDEVNVDVVILLADKQRLVAELIRIGNVKGRLSADDQYIVQKSIAIRKHILILRRG